MSAEKPAQPAKKVKVVKPRPGSKVVPARSKEDKAHLAELENFVQVSLPKSLATMTDEEIMQWAKGLYKSVVEQLSPLVDEQVTVDTDKNLLARARRYGPIPETPEQTTAGADDYLRDCAREYGLDPNSQAVIENLRLYL
jgi:hypothetical protein